MKKIFHIMLPIIAVAIIAVNAFFGHYIFDFSSGLDINKYSLYIHFQPECNSYPKNILYDVTTVWDKPNSNVSTNDPYYDPELDIQIKTEYNPNELKLINNKPYVELQHEFSDCINSWKPLSYRHIINSVGHQIDYLIGLQLNSDPYHVVYPEIINTRYNITEQETKLQKGFSQYIPICTSKDETSYDYSVKINDDRIGFDVYFVPFANEREKYFENREKFTYYEAPGCFGKNLQLFSGTCRNVSKNSGLLIIVPDELKLSLTKITVNLHEME